MQLGLILTRMWRERRLMVVLLLSMCMVTAFLSLGPLYVRSLASAELSLRLDNADEAVFTLDVGNPIPMDHRVDNLLENRLDNLITHNYSYAKYDGTICGFVYIPDQPITSQTPPVNRDCYQPVTFENFDELFSLVDGRLPETITAKMRSGDVQVEAVITTQTAQRNPGQAIEIGARYIIGETPATAIVVEIVGLVEPILEPSDPIWSGHIAYEGLLTPTMSTDIFHFSPIINTDAFQEWVVPASNGNIQYVRQIQLDRELFSAHMLEDFELNLSLLTTELKDIYPSTLAETRLAELIDQFWQSIDEAQGPITLLSALVLVLMLYNLVTIVSLSLEQQAEEWAVFASRGGSTFQLVLIQLITISVLGVIAFIIGPLLAQGILFALSLIGPQAGIIDIVDIGPIPNNALALSLIASVTTVITLTVPAWPFARRSLLHVKQSASRPPTQPLWARLFLDWMLIFIGIALMLRLYSLVSGNVQNSLESLLQDPTLIIHLLANEGVAGLNDPFNLAAPAILLTGLALLWMRLFPRLMQLFGLLFNQAKGLTVRLALWNVERDPGHYGQLVLLLIGTLALGTASLALDSTRKSGAWNAALLELGSDAALSVNTQRFDVNVDWSGLPGVSNGLPLMMVQTENPTATLIGLDIDQALEILPDYSDQLSFLQNLPTLDPGGLFIPADVETLSLDFYAESGNGDEPPISNNIFLELLNSVGVRVLLPMRTEDNTISAQFITYTANLMTDDAGRGPFQLLSIHFETGREGVTEFEHIVYLDNLVAITRTGETHLLEGFEESSLDLLNWASESRQLTKVASISINGEQITQGETSLRLLQRHSRGRDPILTYRATILPPVPVIISPAFANALGARSNVRRSLGKDDIVVSNFDLPQIGSLFINLDINYQVMGIIEQFPTMDDGEVFLITDKQYLQAYIHDSARFNMTNYTGWNNVWLSLETPEPIQSTIEAVREIPGFINIDYAWHRFEQIQREPLANSITGILFAGFWISLGLSLVDFAFYMSMTIRKRATSLGVLRAMGWPGKRIWYMLTVEQAAFVTPALVIGVLLGIGTAYLILPFLALRGGQSLLVPLTSVSALLVILVLAFTIILRFTSRALQRISLNRIMRLTE